MDDDHDSESLFGSPPPSPRPGGLTQLALPGGPGCAQNVGTIALPGSHIRAEPPVPPASSLSGGVQQFFEPPPCASPRPASSSGGARSPAASSQASRSSSVASRRPREKRRSRTTSAAPRAAPPISLPSPDEPTPAYFLRNQEALLGVAGLVSRVRPARLPQAPQPGADKQHAIVIDDEQPAGPGPEAGPSAGDAIRSRPPVLSQEKVLAALLKNQDAITTLGSLLTLMATKKPAAPFTSSTGSASPSQPSSSSGDQAAGWKPAKRRRMHGVPAGAADWDVPFPFPVGDGSRQDSEEWQKLRTKQLVTQLIGLVHTAARNAADEETRKLYGHYRPATAAPVYGRAIDLQRLPPRASAPSAPVQPVAPPQAVTEENNRAASDMGAEAPIMTLEQLLASFTPTAGAGSEGEAATAYSAGANSDPSLSAAQPLGSFEPEGDLDDLMALLHSLPLPGESDVGALDWSTTFDALLAGGSTLAVDDTPGPSNPDSISSLAFEQHPEDPSIDPLLLALSPTQHQPLPDMSFTHFDTASQSSLALSASISVPSVASPASASTSGLMPSPMTSTSSLAGPPTPFWDASFPEPAIASPEQAFDLGFPVAEPTHHQHLTSSSSADLPCLPAIPAPSQASIDFSQLFQQPVVSTIDPSAAFASSRTAPPSHDPSPVPPTPSTVSSGIALPDVSGTVIFKQHIARPGRPVVHPSKTRAGIMRRARERKQQLEAELERAKVELWETTLEQGVLSQIVKESVANTREFVPDRVKGRGGITRV